MTFDALPSSLGFPGSPLGIKAELLLAGTWTDISSYLLPPGITIGRGHPDESTTVSAATFGMNLTSTSSQFSPDNVSSPFYPNLIQNTPCRVSIPEGASYLRSESDTSSGALTTLTAITGDIDIAADMTLDNCWTQGTCIAAQWAATGNERGWLLGVDYNGCLNWNMTSDGTMGTWQQAVSTLPLSAPPAGRMAVRVTYAHSTGVVTFYTGAAGSLGSPSWTQLGATVTLTPASLFASTAPLTAGYAAQADFNTQPWAGWWNTVATYPGFSGKYHALIVLSGIGGTTEASPDFTAQTVPSFSFNDAQSNTWTFHGTGYLDNRNYRGHFECPSWPQADPPYQPSPAGGFTDVTVSVSGGGLLRRYSQRNNPLQSAVYRGIQALAVSPGLAAAWPMEDLSGSTQIASSLGGPAMQFTGSPMLANNSNFLGANALPVLNGAIFTGVVPQYSGTWTDNVVRALVLVPSTGDTTGCPLLSVRTNGTAARADLTYGTGGSLSLTVYNSAGSGIATAGPLTPTFGGTGVNGALMLAGISLRTSGSNVSASIELLDISNDTSSGVTATAFAGTIGQVLEVQVNTFGQLTGTVVGGLTVQPLWTVINSMQGPAMGWAGEPAGWRMSRLCGEEGIPFRSRGSLMGTTVMGVMTPQTLAQLMQACADADQGVWLETRPVLGWGYVCRSAMYNQAAAVALNYGVDELSPHTSAPVRDDQTIVNDVTYTNTDGSSARAYAAAGQPITGGRLSTAAPGSGGTGTYDQTYSVAIQNDSGLMNLAGWRLHLGTTDQARFPGIDVNLANAAATSLQSPVLALDLAQRLTVSNPPPWLGPNLLTQLAQQLTETLWFDTLDVGICGVPELPYEVLQAGGSGPQHADTDGTTLTSSALAGATSLSFTTTSASSPLWTTNAGDFPLVVMISGIQVTVTNITGASSPQTATVSATSAALSAGAAVNVWPPPVAGL